MLAVFNSVVGFGDQLANELVSGLSLSNEEQIKIFLPDIGCTEEQSLAIFP